MMSLNSIYRIWQMKREVFVVLTLCKRASPERKLEILDKALKKKERRGIRKGEVKPRTGNYLLLKTKQEA